MSSFPGEEGGIWCLPCSSKCARRPSRRGAALRIHLAFRVGKGLQPSEAARDAAFLLLLLCGYQNLPVLLSASDPFPGNRKVAHPELTLPGTEHKHRPHCQWRGGGGEGQTFPAGSSACWEGRCPEGFSALFAHLDLKGKVQTLPPPLDQAKDLPSPASCISQQPSGILRCLRSTQGNRTPASGLPGVDLHTHVTDT